MELRMLWCRCSRSDRYNSCFRCSHRYSCLVVSMSRCIIGDRCMGRSMLNNRCYRCLVISLMRGITIGIWGIRSRCLVSICGWYNRCSYIGNGICNCLFYRCNDFHVIS